MNHSPYPVVLDACVLYLELPMTVKALEAYRFII